LQRPSKRYRQQGEHQHADHHCTQQPLHRPSTRCLPRGEHQHGDHHGTQQQLHLPQIWFSPLQGASPWGLDTFEQRKLISQCSTLTIRCRLRYHRRGRQSVLASGSPSLHS
jgi:hypothetical protein